MCTALVETPGSWSASHEFAAEPRPFTPLPSFTRNERLAAQLARLASQHHLSDYSRLKFGVQGCPFNYVPLSVLQPDYYGELQARQADVLGATESWHKCDLAATASPLLGPCGRPLADDSDLACQLMAAITEPFEPQENATLAAPDPQAHPIKTSSTHPINISTIIPPDLLQLVSSHLVLSSRFVPTMFEIPAKFQVDRLVETYAGVPVGQPPPYPPPAMDSPKLLRTRSGMTEALQAAITSDLSSMPPPGIVPGLEVVAPTPARRPPTPARLLSHHSNKSWHALSITVRTEDEDEDEELDEKNARSPTPTTPTFMLGNLFMSSCPGKKVRLQGPVRGRSGVCRDLQTDLRRMRDLGVGCVICCLDDSELALLGAPWDLYAEAALAVGIDVLRIPTPEGLAPLSPESLDDKLNSVLRDYTLRGVPVLVHCRGGVGRAGVVAACWCIKLGLCGWLDEPTFGDASPPPHSRDEVDRATVALVERAIVLLRRRRSVKAIETFEQVRFLVEYVEYLRGTVTGERRSDSLDSDLTLTSDVTMASSL
ncbi:protein-tyrosine phosphatase-like protein [Schizophyllum amplum]|uniref:Protein-tyrosine phosphatase-like protein n=1 Tax=Schizophyllum amplum TaxID=97359 RepID=A0A550CY43_9AGAR|nr:protein-tyrosine phosphatase-like protein [Auriculariopsis ampla]